MLFPSHQLIELVHKYAVCVLTKGRVHLFVPFHPMLHYIVGRGQICKPPKVTVGDLAPTTAIIVDPLQVAAVYLVESR